MSYPTYSFERRNVGPGYRDHDSQLVSDDEDKTEEPIGSPNTQKIKELERAIEYCRKQSQSDTEKLRQSQNNIKYLMEEKQQLQTTLESIQKENHRLSKNGDQLNVENSRLQKANSLLAQQLESHENIIKKLEQENSLLQKDVQRYCSQCVSLQLDLDLQNRKVESFQQELQEYHKSAHQDSTRALNLAREMQQQHKEHTLLQQQLEHRCSELQKELTYQLDQRNTLQEKTLDLEIQCDSLKQSTKKLEEECSKLRQKAEDLKKSTVSAQPLEEKEMLLSTIAELRMQIRQITEETTTETTVRHSLDVRADLLRRVYETYKLIEGGRKGVVSLNGQLKKLPHGLELVLSCQDTLEILVTACQQCEILIRNYFTKTEKLHCGMSTEWFKPIESSHPLPPWVEEDLDSLEVSGKVASILNKPASPRHHTPPRPGSPIRSTHRRSPSPTTSPSMRPSSPTRMSSGSPSSLSLGTPSPTIRIMDQTRTLKTVEVSSNYSIGST